MSAQIQFDTEQIAAYCRKWRIAEFSLFGSVLRDDFRADSDVDVLVEFAPETHYSLFDLVHMQDELRSLFGREVDLVDKRAIERSPNPLRRKAILGTAEVVYAT